MEYTQITLDDWLEMKQKLKRELLGVRQSFVRIGYVLRQIDDQKLYEQDGYKSITEFAKAEYGLEPSTTSRFMSINREYSIDGYSELLRPEYEELGRSQLEEMLLLPDSDRQMVQPEMPRADIRELKRFNRAAPETGTADDIRGLVEKFFEANSEELNGLFGNFAMSQESASDPEWVRRAAELVNPSGNKSFRKGLYFLMLYEKEIKIKKHGETPQTMNWSEFFEITWSVFGDAAAGAKTWEQYFGKKEVAPAQKEEQGEGQEVKEKTGEKPESTEEKEPETKEPAPKAGIEEHAQPERGPAEDEQLPGQDSILNHPECLPEDYRKEPERREESITPSVEETEQPSEEETQPEEIPWRKRFENGECPPETHTCIRNNWGTDEDSQKAGRKECEKCWKKWSGQEELLKESREEESPKEETISKHTPSEPDQEELLSIVSSVQGYVKLENYKAAWQQAQKLEEELRKACLS